jgi:hypothetical protein
MNVTFSTIMFPGSQWTHANGVNRRPVHRRPVQIVGTYFDIQGMHGFVFWSFRDQRG